MSQQEEIQKLDIEVSWVMSATCSVCEDKVGEVELVDIETIECLKCGSWWGIDGDYQGTEPKE